MPRGNPNNLKPNSQRTPEEIKALTSKAGIASGKVRREKKLLSQIYGDVLAEQYEVKVNGKKKKISGEKLIKVVARDVLMRRNSSSVSMMKEMREATEGRNMNISADVNVADVTGGMTHEEKIKLAKLWAEKHLLKE